MATYSPITEAGSQPVVNNTGRQSNISSGRSLWWKYFFDKCFALAMLLFFSPLFLITIAAIYLFERDGVFYRQVRVGEGGRQFHCLKFRTMNRQADKILAQYLRQNHAAREDWEKNHKLKDDPRITCLGGFLRRSSLDELPQFWNVLRGEMSVVGPRPIVIDEVYCYGSDLDYYLSLRPGITGLWQVSGRSDLGFDERVKLDVTCVKNLSFGLDLKILLKTIKVVLFQEGAR